MKGIIKTKCPICCGSGEIAYPSNKPKEIINKKVDIVKKLKETGYSVREIMKIMNYKSPQAISYLLKK